MDKEQLVVKLKPLSLIVLPEDTPYEDVVEFQRLFSQTDLNEIHTAVTTTPIRVFNIEGDKIYEVMEEKKFFGFVKVTAKSPPPSTPRTGDD